MANYTRNDLVAAVARQCNLPVDRARHYVEAVFEVMSTTLAEGVRMQFRNFGMFDVVVRKQKVGRNPRDPEHGVVIPPRRAVRFRPGKELYHRLNPGEMVC